MRTARDSNNATRDSHGQFAVADTAYESLHLSPPFPRSSRNISARLRGSPRSSGGMTGFWERSPASLTARRRRDTYTRRRASLGGSRASAGVCTIWFSWSPA